MFLIYLTRKYLIQKQEKMKYFGMVVYSPADSPASLSAKPGKDAARAMTAFSGRKCCALG